jgi:hypothetical protein
MSAAMKYVRHSSFPATNASYLPSGWFWKMTLREWAFAQVDVVDNVPILGAMVGATNNPVIRNVESSRSSDSKTVTIKFYAHSPGNAYVYLNDPATNSPFTAAEKIQMQVEILPRRAAKPEETSLTRLDGKTVAINAPDTESYEMTSSEIFRASDPLEIFKRVPADTDHVVLASHGITVGGDVCMFIGGANKSSLRLGLTNVEAVFGLLKGKVAKNCVIWLGGCGIGSNNEFCLKAANASGCPVIAAGHVLVNKKFAKNFVDILDRVSMPKLFLPGKTSPSDMGDFCATQESRKFVVPV